MAEVANLRALVVGVDRYEAPAEPGAFRYPSLYGAVSDARRVERYLTGTLGMSPERIEVLLSPHAGWGSERPATAAELVAALLRLEAACGDGDHALVFYSGHGGRAPTRLPEVKGAAGIDEVLAPMDVADPATPYLHDVEIAAYLARMAARGAFVTLILDCCHSGGAPRDRRRFRGVDCVDRTARPASGLAADPEELLRVWRPPRAGAVRSLSLVPTSAQEPRGWTSLAACRPHERALEDSIHGGDPSGLLTHFLLEALERAEPGLTYRRLHSTICTRLHSFYPGQTPMVDGEADRLVFGRETLPVPVGIEVTGVEGFDGRTLELAAGRVQGVQRGARFSIVKASEAGFGGTPYAQAEVLETGQATSRARVTWTGGADGRPQPGDRAFVVDPGPLVAKRRVAWSAREDEGAGFEAAADFMRLVAEAGGGLLVPAAPGESHDFEVAEANGSYEIRDRAGAPIPALGPPLLPSDPSTWPELIRRLSHLARYWNLRAHENAGWPALLREALQLELELPEEMAAVIPGTKVRLTLINRADEPFNIAVLDLQPDWGVTQVFPAGGPFAVLEPGAPLSLDLEAYLPEGWTEGTDVLKALAAAEPFDPSALKMPPLAAAMASSGRPAIRRAGGGLSGFAALLDPFGGNGSARGAARSVHTASERWTSAQVELRVVRQAAPPSVRAVRTSNRAPERPASPSGALVFTRRT